MSTEIAGNTSEHLYDRCLRRRWAGLRYLYRIINSPPYRFHSVACALEATPGASYTICKTSFVARLMAEYQFDCKLRMDVRLASLYSSFEGAPANQVDYRDILSSLVFLRRFKMSRDDPRTLFCDLLLLYSDDSDTTVRRADALRLARMGAMSGADVLQTSVRLDKYLVDEAVGRGLKPTFRELHVSLLMEILDHSPTVLAAFGAQLWQRAPQAWRMGALKDAETIGVDKAGSGAVAIKLRRAARWHTKTMTRRVLAGWRVFRNRSKLARAQRAAVQITVHQTALRLWHTKTSGKARYRKLAAVASARGRSITISRSFRRITEYARMQKKLAAMTWAFSKEGKLVVAGVGLLRGVVRKRSMRSALTEWCEAASLMKAWEFAVDVSRERLSRRVFVLYRDVVKELVAARRADDEAEARAAGVLEAMEEAEKEKALLLEAAEAEARRHKTKAKEALRKERTEANQARVEEARAIATARDAKIAERQRAARRQRVYEEGANVKQEFDAEWETRFNEMVQHEMTATREWLQTHKDASFKVQKELHILKRRFFAAPTPETSDMERALRDPSNVIFAHMANLLYKGNISLHDFFHRYDKEGDGYLAHEEFKGMVSSLKINLSGEQIRSVIRAIDLDGGGYIDFPEFEAAVKKHEDVCGAAGSPWKMYISPVHAIMILHNVETNEEIWDYMAVDKDLLRVVKDNIVGLDGIAAKAKATKEREGAWQKLLKDRAASTLQRFCRVWAARKKRKLLRWKWDVEKARDKTRLQNRAALNVQCWWRVLKAKWLALQLLHIAVEVLFDPGSNEQYYFNHALGEASWQIPSMLKRWKGEHARMEPVPEWVLISRIYGQSYFYNTRSHLRSQDKPAGYILCSSCRTHLATRRCIVEGLELCFVCFRRDHLDGDEACWHEWEPSSTYTCAMCCQRDATLACIECNHSKKNDGCHETLMGAGDRYLLCDSCWSRTHPHPDVCRHRGVPVDHLSGIESGNDRGGQLTAYGGVWSQEDAGEAWFGGGTAWRVGEDKEGAVYNGADEYGHDANGVREGASEPSLLRS